MTQEELAQRLLDEPHWFRVTARHYATVNDYGEVDGRWSDLRIEKIEVVRHTPKGAWLRVGFKPAFLKREYRHRGRAYAAPTEAQAREDFRKRKQFRISMLQKQIDRAQQEINLLDQHTLFNLTLGTRP